MDSQQHTKTGRPHSSQIAHRFLTFHRRILLFSQSLSLFTIFKAHDASFCYPFAFLVDVSFLHPRRSTRLSSLVRMLAFLVPLAASQLTTLSFLSLHPYNRILTFGAEPGGAFDLAFRSSPADGQIRGFFMTESELAKFDTSSLAEFCFPSTLEISALNFSSPASERALTWSGVFRKRSVYTLFLWECGVSRSNFTLSAQFANPSTRLDTRDVILPSIYGRFSIVYVALGFVWTVNALCFVNFRIPLHTLFLLLPIIRSCSLYNSRLFWIQASVSDAPGYAQILIISFLEFMFYTLTLAGISFACAGFCIYRHKFYLRDRIEILLSSALVVGGILSAQFIGNIQQAFVVLGSICFSVIWYLRQGIILVVMVTNLMRQMESEPLVIAKVRLSRNFVVSSCCVMLLTMTAGSVAAGLEFQKWICVLVVEIGMLTNTALQLKYFLLRKKYGGSEEIEGKKRPVKRPAVLSDPVRSGLVVLSS
jgi:hypothetical protein